MEQRILIYGARDGGTGLRHGIGIADSLTRRLPEAVILLLASGNPEWMALPERLLFVPLPLDGHRRQPRSQMTMRARLLGDLINQFTPHGVLLDGDPIELHRELPAVFADAQRTGSRPPLFLVVRDIDVPALARARGNGTPDVLAWCDRVLLAADPYAAERSDLVLNGSTPANMQHVGWTAPRPRRNALSAVRAALGFNGRYVLCAISTRESVALARVFLAVAGMRSASWRGAVLVPPQLGVRVVTALRHAAPESVTVQVRRPALDDAIASAEVVVTTLTDDAAPEALFHGRRLVAVHQSAHTPAQELRARALEQHDRVRVLPPRPVSVPMLARAIDSLMATPVPGRRPIWARPDRLADTVAAMLQDRESSASA
jgi:predicted glycosyltransferase